MCYWWVNQYQTFRQEVEGGYLWSHSRRGYQPRIIEAAFRDALEINESAIDDLCGETSAEQAAPLSKVRAR